MAGFQRIGFLLLAFYLTVKGDNDDYKTRCPSLPMTYKMTLYKDTCYQFYYGSKTWEDAKDYCWQRSGRLVKIDDANTYNFIKNKLNTLGWNTNDLWIGLNDMNQELEWEWVGKYEEPGEKMTWSNWHDDHPQAWLHSYRDCIKMSKDGGDWTWHEVTCNMNPWTYRFICEYDATGPSSGGDDLENIESGVGGHYQSNGPTPPPRTTNQHSTYFTRRGGSNGDIRTGGHRVDSEGNVLGDYGEQAGENNPNGAEKAQGDDDGDVPLYAVIVSFGAGVVFACAIILFIVIRRRKRRKSESDSYPSVVYHSQSSVVERGVSGGSAGGAMVGAVAAARNPLTCSMTGRPCKMAINSKSQKCICQGEHETISCGQGNSSNLYVSIREADMRRKGLSCGISADPISEGSDPGPSVTSSIRDISMDEQPPTYDEVCGGAASGELRTENLYTHEPHRPIHRSVESLRQREEPSGSQPHQGAIPKIPKSSTDTYLPMNGSPKSQGHHRSSSANQYVPMSLDVASSLGELPPIPTDEGYEIPVATKLEPEAVKSLHSPIEESTSPIDGPSSIYSEITIDRNSRLLHNGDQIYSTIE